MQILCFFEKVLFTGDLIQFINIKVSKSFLKKLLKLKSTFQYPKPLNSYTKHKH